MLQRGSAGVVHVQGAKSPHSSLAVPTCCANFLRRPIHLAKLLTWKKPVLLPKAHTVEPHTE